MEQFYFIFPVSSYEILLFISCIHNKNLKCIRLKNFSYQNFYLKMSSTKFEQYFNRTLWVNSYNRWQDKMRSAEY